MLDESADETINGEGQKGEKRKNAAK